MQFFNLQEPLIYPYRFIRFPGQFQGSVQINDPYEKSDPILTPIFESMSQPYKTMGICKTKGLVVAVCPSGPTIWVKSLL